jgi:hypothetical protein
MTTTTLSLSSSSSQSPVNGLKKLFASIFSANTVDTSDIWSLYRATGRSDSVNPAAVRALAKAAAAK